MRALPAYEDVVDAAARLAAVAVRTPLLESPALDEAVGGRVLVKAEMLQRTGTFKFRGAYNRLSRLSDDERRRGVVAYSSGNHAQGIAAAAAMLGLRATLVMPADAPWVKIDGTRRFGAEIVFYDRARESREAVGQRLVTERGAVLVPPYDDFHVIAGQGALGLELAEQLRAAGAEPEAVLCPCGGGGLIAGVALALEKALPGTALHPVEPVGLDETGRSLRAGRRLSNDPGATSLCDALLAPTPGELTFAINRHRLANGLAVSDAEVLAAMAFAFRHLKVVVEPGGAVALAALLAKRYDARRRTVAVVCSGGNADPAIYRRALETAAPAATVDGNGA